MEVDVTQLHCGIDHYPKISDRLESIFASHPGPLKESEMQTFASAICNLRTLESSDTPKGPEPVVLSTFHLEVIADVYGVANALSSHYGHSPDDLMRAFMTAQKAHNETGTPAYLSILIGGE